MNLRDKFLEGISLESPEQLDELMKELEEAYAGATKLHVDATKDSVQSALAVVELTSQVAAIPKGDLEARLDKLTELVEAYGEAFNDRTQQAHALAECSQYLALSTTLALNVLKAQLPNDFRAVDEGIKSIKAMLFDMMTSKAGKQ